MDLDIRQIPVTPEGRDQLLRTVESLRQGDDKRALGNALATIAHITKHVGAPDAVADAFPTAAAYGRESVALLREHGDKAELARALRLAAVPLEPMDHASMLEESLALAREAGALEEEGWTLYRMTQANGVPGHTVEEALAAFEACGCLAGQAACLLSLGFSRSPKEPDLIDRAVAIYDQWGDERNANMARTFAQVARQEWGWIQDGSHPARQISSVLWLEPKVAIERDEVAELRKAE